MKSKLLTASLLASALLAGLAAAPAMAQNTYTPGIDRAQADVHARIHQGLESGQITPSEAQQLYRRDSNISLRESQYKADGRATPAERQQLRADLDGLKAEVERMIANRNVVGGTVAGGGIDRSEFNIRARIEEGVRARLITPREADRLHRRERMIDRHEAAYRADGVLTPRERGQLRSELTVLRDEVERMMNNNRRG
jgi:Spy/CpxP family protein refolding chaperone